MPSRLKEYPVGTVMPTTGFETPRCSILAMSRGSADSDDEVPTISRYSRPRYFMRLRMFTRVTACSSDPSTAKTKTAHVM